MGKRLAPRGNARMTPNIVKEEKSDNLFTLAPPQNNGVQLPHFAQNPSLSIALIIFNIDA